MTQKERMMKMKKRWLFCLLFFLLSCLLPAPVFAAQEEAEQYYQDQMEASGADQLPDYLPEEAKKIMGDLGVGDLSQEGIINLSPEQILEQSLKLAGEYAASPVRAAASVIGVLLLCSLLQGIKGSFGEKELSRVFGVVCVLVSIAFLVVPIVDCVVRTSETVQGSFVFVTAFVPVLSGIMTASGQPVTAGSYSLTMLVTSDAATALFSTVVMPMLNIILAIAVVSAAAPRLNIGGVSSFIQKAVKWVLGFTMTIFVSVLSIQGAVGSSADSVTMKAAKFVIGNAIPVVGGAISDAVASVQSYLGLLKTTVGAFGILAGACIFLPVLIEQILWLIAVNICLVVSDIFEMKEISSLLKAVNGVIGLMIAVAISCALILVISSGIMMSFSSAKG